MADVPAYFEGGRGHWGEFGADVEDAIELAVGEWSRDVCGDPYKHSRELISTYNGNNPKSCAPCLAKSHISDAVFISKGQVEFAEGVKGAAIEANVLM